MKMKYKDVKIIVQYPDTSKIKKPLIMLYNVEIRDNLWASHNEFTMKIYYPAIKRPFKYGETFKTLMKAFNAAKKMAFIMKINDIVKMRG